MSTKLSASWTSSGNYDGECKLTEANPNPPQRRHKLFPWSQHPLGHARYNLLIDPWFEGTQIDFFPWFSRQSHAVSPIVTSIADLNNYLADVENSIQQRSSLPTNAEPDTKAKSRNPYIDAIMISHEFTDHCNEHTLREVDANTPIVATKAAAKVIRSWCHFKNVQEISNFAAISHDSAKSLSVSLPSWLWFSRLVSNLDIGYLHSAVMICFSLQQKQSQPTRAAEAIIYTPHGIHADKISQIAHATPSIQPLALIHGLHEVFVCRVGQINLGAVNGLEVQKSSGARYWISTHDEIKDGKGLISYLLGRNKLTIHEAAEKARLKRGSGAVDSSFDLSAFQFAELRSGESISLE